MTNGVAAEPEEGLNAHYHPANDPYQFAADNGLGPIEMHVVKYVTRHRAKGGRRDLLAGIGALTRLVIDVYGCTEEDAVKAVTDVFRRRGVGSRF